MAMWQARIIGEDTVSPSELLSHPLNWRTHPASQKTQMTAALDGIGWIQRVIVSKRTGRIIDGHLRVELAREKGEAVPVAFVDLTEEEERLALATFDFITSQAEQSKEDLQALLFEIENGSGDLLETLRPVVDAIIEEMRVGRVPGLGSSAPDAPLSRVKLGDLWTIGEGHRLFCGDATEPGAVSTLLDGALPLLMVTDPPYGVDYDPEWRQEAAEKGLIRYPARGLGHVSNDNRSDWTEALALFPGPIIYLWHSGLMGAIATRSLEALGFDIRNQIIWSKPFFAISRGHYNWKHEPCYYAVRKGSTASWIGDHQQSTVWEINWDEAEESSDHSTQKPLETVARAVRNHGAPGDIVYDPFIGSGTTLIAAHRERRLCYGMEIEPRYCDVVLARAEAEGLEVQGGPVNDLP